MASDSLAVFRALEEYERAFADCVDRDPDIWTQFHTSRLAAARGRAQRIIEEGSPNEEAGSPAPDRSA